MIFRRAILGRPFFATIQRLNLRQSGLLVRYIYAARLYSSSTVVKTLPVRQVEPLSKLQKIATTRFTSKEQFLPVADDFMKTAEEEVASASAPD